MKNHESPWIKHAKECNYIMWWIFTNNKCSSCIYKLPLNHNPKDYCNMFAKSNTKVIECCPCYFSQQQKHNIYGLCATKSKKI